MADDNDFMNFDVTALDKKDAFAEAQGGTQTIEKVHIRLQQRSRRKCILTITGLADDLDLKRICKALKKSFKCNGAVVNDDDFGEIIQLQGDHRQGVVKFLVDEEIIDRSHIVVHGA
ncbi:Protein translation factor sui1 [Hondaea fermentalgiana]|uniref:Protein translation factor sui1 n=1 Tax=Hondaea fermentalgiana TaxID=2315210 RepID=A0A2R5G3Y9_9STRA|nr:Protein translation factor sui1 [Hondaea fermentalgiana]|eukprot:GBG25710.1 Protein translation factor sui1 [Hondaea fermentalgiana]